MLEYFTYKKVKKHQAEKKARDSQVNSPALSPGPASPGTRTKPAPVLSREDENFLERIVSPEGERPPLPQRPQSLMEAGDATGNQSQMMLHDGRVNTEAENEDQHKHGHKDKGKGKEGDAPGKDTQQDAKKGGRFSFIQRTFTKKDKKLDPKPVVSPEEAASEKDDINKILEDLNLSAVNNRAFSISAESQALIQKFTVILKDLVNGVPTAYDDLTHLLDNSQDTLEKSYDALPSFLQKLITSLPTKLTGSLAPELLATAAEAQKLSTGGQAAAAGSAGFGATAKSFLTPNNLKDLVTKPGAVVSMLKAIMNALKLRWPAFMGTNVLLSLGLFVLLFVFWYCHKRGREERLKREGAPVTVDSEGRIIELEDDPMLAPAGPSRTETSQSERQSDRLRPDDREQRRTSSRDDRRSSPRSDRERGDREHRHSSSRDDSRSSPRSDRERGDREHRHSSSRDNGRSSPRSHRSRDDRPGSSRRSSKHGEGKHLREKNREYASAGEKDTDRR